MMYVAPTSSENQGSFVAGLLWYGGGVGDAPH